MEGEGEGEGVIIYLSNGISVNDYSFDSSGFPWHVLSMEYLGVILRKG